MVVSVGMDLSNLSGDLYCAAAAVVLLGMEGGRHLDPDTMEG